MTEISLDPLPGPRRRAPAETLTTSEHWADIAHQARREGLLESLRRHPNLTIGQLCWLVNNGKYAAELGQLTVAELLTPPRREHRIARRVGESDRDAVMRVFAARPGEPLSSGFFVRYMGLRRWDAQRVLAELAEEGQLERTGKTSSTRYRLSPSMVGARTRRLEQ